MLYTLQANSHGKVKEMNKLLALLFGLTLSLPSAHAEITSESFLFEVFDGCIEEPMEDTALGAQLEYCACFTNLMSKEMTLEEATMLSLDILAADDDEQGEKVLLANEKARKLIAQCMPRLYD